MIYIYALLDPFTEDIRYIGKSIRPRERLTNHCNEHSVNHRTNWIQSLLAQGVQPQLKILQELPDDADWQTVERAWIAKGKAENWPLTNGTSGGDGVHDLTPEAKERMATTWIGRKHKPESLIKIGQASKERYHTKEYCQYMHDILVGREFSQKTRRLISLKVRKLTDKQVLEIRDLLAQSVSQYKIADMYGVHQGTISNIKRGLCYQDVIPTLPESAQLDPELSKGGCDWLDQATKITTSEQESREDRNLALPLNGSREFHLFK